MVRRGEGSREFWRKSSIRRVFESGKEEMSVGKVEKNVIFCSRNIMEEE